MFFYLAFLHPEIKHGFSGIGGHSEMKSNIMQGCQSSLLQVFSDFYGGHIFLGSAH